MQSLTTLVLPTTLVVLGLALPNTALAERDKVDVCHPYAAETITHILTVSESSVEAHLGHGDWVVSREMRGDEIDNDCDGLVDEHEPVVWAWELSAGVQDGQLVDAWSDGVQVPPVLLIYLFDEDFMATWSDAEMCTLPFVVGSTTGTSDPDAWFDWVLSLVPSTDHYLTCDNLDPTAFEGDPWAAFSAYSWEFSIVPIDAATSEIVESWYPGTTDYVFGGDTWLDAVAVSAWEGADFMVDYGWATAVDGAMEIGDDLIETSDIAAGADGYYLISGTYFLGL